MLVQIYVNDIIFGSTDPMMVVDFAKLMVSRFQMSINREISFFLELQVKQTMRIDIQYHFIIDHVLKGKVELIFFPYEDEVANVFTKALDETKFNKFLNKMGMMM